MSDFATIVLKADTKGLKDGERGLDGLSNSSAAAAKKVDTSSSKITKAFTRVGASIFSAAAAAASIRTLISTNAEFGASMSKVAAISGATGIELERLRDAAKEMGATTKFSASQAADALGFLSMAGFSATESLSALPDVLALAAAGGLELASAADIASNVLSGFGLSANEASRASDVLAVAASSTNTNVSQLGQAMSTAAPIAATLGVSMETTAAAIGVMSDAGIQGERAGTALRGVFASLAGPTKQASDALAKYGLTAADVDPQASSLVEVLSRLRDAGISTADAMTIFGRESASGALVMIDASSRVQELTQSFLNADGAAQGMADTMSDNLRGDTLALRSALEGLIITIGDQGVAGGFRSLAQSATAALRAISENMQLLVGVMGTLASGFVAYKATVIAADLALKVKASSLAIYGAGVATVTRHVGLLAGAKTALSAATAGATAALRVLTGALIANPFGAVAVTVGVLTGAFYALAQSQRVARQETVNLISSLSALAKARSEDFALKRIEVQSERDSLELELNNLERRKRDLQRSPELSQRPGSSGRLKGIQDDIYATRQRILELNDALFKADRDFRKASEAAERFVAPAAEAATAIKQVNVAATGVPKSVGGASAAIRSSGSAFDAANKAVEGFGNLMARLFPELERYRRYQQDRIAIEQAVTKELLTQAQAMEALKRLSREYLDAQYGERKVLLFSDSAAKNRVFDTDTMREHGKEVEKILIGMGSTTQTQTVQIAQSFKDMAQSVLGSMRGLVDGIRKGDFLSILQGVLDIILQLAGAGVFGKKVQTNVNKPPPSFDGGGYTGGRARSGGLDGKGGFLAMLHPQETVVDHTKGQSGGMVVRVYMDPSTAALGAVIEDRSGKVVSQAAPLIAQAGANMAGAQMAYAQRRQVRR